MLKPKGTFAGFSTKMMYLGYRYGKDKQGLLGWCSSYVPDRPGDLGYHSFGMLNHPKQKYENHTKYKKKKKRHKSIERIENKKLQKKNKNTLSNNITSQFKIETRNTQSQQEYSIS